MSGRREAELKAASARRAVAAADTRTRLTKDVSRNTALEMVRQARAAFDVVKTQRDEMVEVVGDAHRLLQLTQAVLADVVGCEPDGRVRARGFVRLWPTSVAVRFAKASTVQAWKRALPESRGGPPADPEQE